MLQLLVAIVNAELLQGVFGEEFEPEYVQNANYQNVFFVFLLRCRFQGVVYEADDELAKFRKGSLGKGVASSTRLFRAAVRYVEFFSTIDSEGESRPIVFLSLRHIGPHWAVAQREEHDGPVTLVSWSTSDRACSTFCVARTTDRVPM